jgi:hypothetical protein
VTVVTVRADKPVPATMRSVAISYNATTGTGWALAVDAFTGATHLEGKQVSILADGFVASSPNNSDYPTLTISGGAVTLPRPAAVVRVGLPVTADLETLDIDTVSGESLKSKRISVKEVSLYFEKTRGPFVGRAIPTGDDPLFNMDSFPSFEDEGSDEPPALITNDRKSPITSSPDTHGRIAIRQVDPLPVTILAAIPIGDVG